MSSLDKVLALANEMGVGGKVQVLPQSPDAEVDQLVLAAQAGARRLAVLLAADDENDTEPEDTDDDTDDDSKGGGGSHANHPTYKKLIAKKVNPKMAAAMCAKADNKVEATNLVSALQVILTDLTTWGFVSLAAPKGESAGERRDSASKGEALPDGSYPVHDKKHLHSAAVLAASHHGDWKAAQQLIRKQAKKLGVDVNTLPGFGSSDKDEKVAASAVRELVSLTGLPEDHAIEFLSLAAKAAVPMQAFHHGPMHGMHKHGHMTMVVHDHDHAHNGDSMHDRHSHGSGSGGYPGDDEMARPY